MGNVHAWRHLFARVLSHAPVTLTAHCWIALRRPSLVNSKAFHTLNDRLENPLNPKVSVSPFHALSLQLSAAWLLTGTSLYLSDLKSFTIWNKTAEITAIAMKYNILFILGGWHLIEGRRTFMPFGLDGKWAALNISLSAGKANGRLIGLYRWRKCFHRVAMTVLHWTEDVVVMVEHLDT